MMKTMMMIGVLAAVSGCSQTQQGTAIGGLGGAAIGSAVASSGNRAEGALVGGAIGAVAGGLIGNANERNDGRYESGRNGARQYRSECLYVDRHGREYYASCRY